MRIFDQLVRSYRSKKYKEFRKLCVESFTLDENSFMRLNDLLDSTPDVDYAYAIFLEEYVEQGLDKQCEWGE